ncbi:hypothetical protein [Caulobacter sp. NIBR1757]|uniref:beta strand repeat-containing protein n=1 Tax=Caulobacter sp. NIBR1757 TaxID=3016000 RepID=UPI0022F13C51|nr:hypothetical protein [Caulobacter sp. NIBR1757]WGM40215.1 hypothetical protein AMEJIAPC_03156 [Caulobacter sp. NIBR1757]
MAASTLTTGDVAVVGFNTAQTDGSGDPATTNVIQFVLLAPIGSGTVIYFTDRTWNGSAFTAGGGDGTFTYTAGADLPAGTVITITAGQLTTAGIDLDEAGDALYIFQGTDANTPTTFLSAIEFGDNGTFNGSLANTGLVVGTSALAIDADSGAYAGPTTHQHNALVNPGQSLLQAIMDAANWTTDNRDTTNADVQILPDVLLTAPDFLIVGATNGGSGDGVVLISGDATVSSGTAGFNQVRVYNSDGDESAGYQTMHVRPRDIVIDTVAGKYFFLDSDQAGTNRIYQGNLSDLLGNPGSTSVPTLTILYSDAASGNASQILNLVIDEDNHQVFFSHGSTIQRVNYDTAGQTPVTLVNLGSGNPNGNANNFVDDFTINFATGHIYISSHRVTAAADGDIVSRNYIYDASGLTSGSAGALTYGVLPFSPDDDDAGVLTTPGEAFPRELGSLEGVEISPDGTMLYFATATLLEDTDGDGGTGGGSGTAPVVRPGGIYSYALTGNAAGTFTQIYVQTPGGGGPQGLLDDFEIDFTTGRWYVTDTTGGTGGAGDEGIWSGLLTGGGVVFFENVSNTNGMQLDGFDIYRAPTLTVTSSAATYTETAGANSGFDTAVQVISSAAANDLDTTGLADNLAGAVIRISSGFQSGASHQDRLTIDGSVSGTIAGSGIAYSYSDSTGIMTLTGAATFAEYQAALALVRYAVSGDNPTNYGANGTRTIAFSVSDGLMVSDEQGVSVTVTGVNDNPVNSVGAGGSVNEDVGSVAVTGISVSDADANPATQDITVTLTSEYGVLTLLTNVSGGLTGGDISGNGTASVTITGTQNEINATLAAVNGLVLGSIPANLNGGIDITVATNDGGFGGTGGALSDSDVRTITVTALNDAPVVSGDGTETAVQVTEDTNSNSLTQTFSSLLSGQYSDAADNQSGNGGSSAGAFTGVAVIANGSAAGVGQWQAWNGASWINIGTASEAVAQMFSVSTPIRFSPSANFNGPAPTLTVVLVDNSGSSITFGEDRDVSTRGGTTPYSTGTVVISQPNIIAVNDAPTVIGGTTTTLTAISEDAVNPAGDTVANLFGTHFSDAADNVAGGSSPNTFAGIMIGINNANSATQGVWQVFTGGSWINLPTLSPTNTYLVSSSDSLRFVPNANYSGNPGSIVVLLIDSSAGPVVTGTRLDSSLTGSGGSTVYSNSTMTLSTSVTAVNDAPTVNADTTATFTEGAGAIAVTPAFTVTDVDSANMTGATISISDFVAGDTLIFVDQNGITGVYNSGTGVLTLSGSATVANYQAAIRSITYDFTGDANVGGTDNSRTVNITVTDGTTPSSQTATVITIVDGGGDAQDDAFSTTESAPIVAGDLLADNGSGADSGVSDITEVNGAAITYGVQFALPSGALLTVYANGTFDYDPNGAFDDLVDASAGAGNSDDTDTFTYTVDGGDVATVTIIINGETDSGDIYLGTGGGDTITGNGIGNTVNAGGGNDTVDGLGGGDVINGEAGDDTLNGGDQADKLNGGDDNDQLNGDEGNDILNGGAGADDLVGGNGNDTLDGGTGADDMNGGAGNDVYFVDDAGDTITDSSGIDTVKSLGTYVLGAGLEHLTLLGSGDSDGTGNASNNTINGNDGVNILSGMDGADKLYGFGGKDYLDGGSGNDVLDGGDSNDQVHGGLGNDTAAGGAGNDSVFGEDGNDQLDGGDGADKLYGGAGLDQLVGGIGNDYMYGGSETDTLTGGDGNDYLDGEAGPDKMYGGLGNDVYIVNEYNDVVSENVGEGYDVVRSSAATYIMGDNIEALELTAGAGDISGTGNSAANAITGNEGVNILDGKAGVDTINGGAGNDVIYGGLGNDLLTGGSGYDVFAVRQESVGLVTLETDRIFDFSVAGGDRVDLSAIDANANLAGNQAFHFATVLSTFSGVAGEATLTYDATTASTYLRLDVNGDKKADYSLRLDGDHTGTSGNVIAPGTFLDGTGGWIL